MKATAAVSRTPGDHVSIETVEVDAPRADELLISVAAVGICHTDHSVMHQHFWPPIPLPMVLGHEGAGYVEAVGPGVTGFKPGDAVVMTINGCGHCQRCGEGLPGYCQDAFKLNFGRTRLDGSATVSDAAGPIGAAFFGQSSFATRAISSVYNTVKIPNDFPIELAGPLGCGLQTGAGAVLNTLKPRAGQSIAILGVGTVGLAAVMAATIAGCTPIIAVDRRVSRLDMARELGATHCINTDNSDLAEQLKAAAPGGLDGAIDCSAVPSLFMTTVDALRTGGTLILVGAPPGDVSVQLPLNSLLIGRTLRGSIQGDSNPHEFIPRLIELYRQGKFPFDKFVQLYPFAEIDKAVHDSAITGTTIKALLRMPPN